MMFSDAGSAFSTGRDNEFVKFDSLFVSEQKDQEEMRRRFASITYSDPLQWAPPRAEGKLILSRYL